jgi:hypothetical protein
MRDDREQFAMLRLGLGALVAAFLMFMWGFVFWASGLIDPASHMSPEGETAIAEALRTHTTQHALYFIPDSKNGTPDEAAARMAQGPFAMIYVKPSGATMGDPAVMGMGFAHMFVTALSIGVLLTWVLPATPGWTDRFKVAVLVGAIGTWFGVTGEAIWWHHAWSTSLLFSGFDFVAYLIAGAVMAWTVRA